MNNTIKISPYLYLFHNNEAGYMAYNGINNSFMKLNYELFDCLQRAKKDVAVLEELDNTTFQKLKQSNIIATAKEIQFFISQKKFLRRKSDFQHDYLSLTIAPTTACNFSCPYCFEKGINFKTMNQEVIESTIAFIERQSKMTNNKVEITWYGGEPLLAIDKIQEIYKRIKAKGIELISSGMITNGYYLNDENQEILNNIGVKTLQITLDGATPDAHNKKRFTRNGNGTWKIILKNIDSLLNKNENIEISVRCNIDKSNKGDFVVLKEQLDKRWKNNKNIFIYPAILRDHDVDAHSVCQFFSDREASDYMIQSGVQTKNLPYFQYNVGGCSATMLNSYLIGPEGELYKCWNDLGRADKVIGNVAPDSSVNQKLLFDYIVSPSIFDDPKCEKCELFFVCEGACQWDRLKAQEEGKQHNSCHLAKNNMEKYLGEYLKLKKLMSKAPIESK